MAPKIAFWPLKIAFWVHYVRGRQEEADVEYRLLSSKKVVDGEKNEYSIVKENNIKRSKSWGDSFDI